MFHASVILRSFSRMFDGSDGTNTTSFTYTHKINDMHTVLSPVTWGASSIRASTLRPSPCSVLLGDEIRRIFMKGTHKPVN
jgi:hypothetical protein